MFVEKWEFERGGLLEELLHWRHSDMLLGQVYEPCADLAVYPS